MANTDTPVFGQKFVVESKQATTRVAVALYDRSDDAEALLASGSVEVGPPAREVGCRWLALTPAREGSAARSAELAPKVRVVWQCSDVMLATEEVSRAVEGESASLRATRAAEASASLTALSLFMWC